MLHPNHPKTLSKVFICVPHPYYRGCGPYVPSNPPQVTGLWGGGRCCVMPYIYLVIVIVITTYHAVYWSYRACRADRWFLPRSIPWVPGLREVAHSLTEDAEHRGYRSTRLWGQRQLQSFSISNGDARWPVCSPGVNGQGIAMQQQRNKQKARASPTGATQQPRYRAARMRRSKSGPLLVCVLPSPWRCPPPLTRCNRVPACNGL